MLEPSNTLCVDRIVLLMGTDKPDINDAVRIVNPDHEAFLIAGDVKDRATVLKNTGAANISLNVRRSRPVGPPYLSKPRHQRLAGIGNISASGKKRLDCSD